MLVHEYKLCKIKSNESIIDIINDLKNFGKSYNNNELVQKIIKLLSKNCRTF